MVNRTHSANAFVRVISFVAVGALLGLNLNSYRLQEVLVFWLLFSLAFVSLAFAVLVGALVCCVGERVIAWASKAARETPKIVHGPPQFN